MPQPPKLVIDASTDPNQLAKDVMRKADWFQRNGSITESELRTSLERTPYGEFCGWLSEGRPSRFKKYDRSKGGALEMEELREVPGTYHDTLIRTPPKQL